MRNKELIAEQALRIEPELRGVPQSLRSIIVEAVAFPSPSPTSHACRRGSWQDRLPHRQASRVCKKAQDVEHEVGSFWMLTGKNLPPEPVESWFHSDLSARFGTW